MRSAKIVICARASCAFALMAFIYYEMSTSGTYTGTSSIVSHFMNKNEKNVDHIWPRRDGIETNDRMVNQMKFIDEFWPRGKTGDTTKPLPLRPNQTKVILRIGHLSYDPFMQGQKYFVKQNCPINSCTITGDMSVRHTADALYLYNFNVHSPINLLPKPSHQIWIAHHSESPKFTGIKPHQLNDLINWTVTYRRDSTIPYRYTNFVPVANAAPITGVNYASGKTEKVVWWVSNCNPKRREYYARELSKYIDVDIYGKCGTKNCTRRDACEKAISRRYKFYLAFENAHCKDYITEKFFDNSLRRNLLPIVMGAPREDYVLAAPPRSYIHVDDFRSPRELAAYLHHLDKNDTAYNEYFAWKGTFERASARTWCRLCTLLHQQEQDNYVHWYTDYASWWNGVCTEEHNLLSNSTK